MTDNYNSKKASKMDANIINSMLMQIKLILRLMSDTRVSSLIKLLPIISIFYLILPIDFVPGGLMTVIGAADDVAVMWFGFTLFLELCPTDIMDEHIAELTGKVVSTSAGDVVEGEIVDGKE